MNTPIAVACSLVTLTTCHQAAVANPEPEVISPLPKAIAPVVTPVDAVEVAPLEQITVAIAPPETLSVERTIPPQRELLRIASSETRLSETHAPAPLIVPVETVETVETTEAPITQISDSQQVAAHWEEDYANPFLPLEMDSESEDYTNPFPALKADSATVEEYVNPFPTLEVDSETVDHTSATVKSTEEYHYSVIRMDDIAQLDPSLQPEPIVTDEELEPVDWSDPADLPPPLAEEDVEESGDSSDLGEIQTRSSQARQPSLQLVLRSSVSTSSDIDTFLNSTGNTVFTNGAYLLATPQLGPRTRFIGTAGIQFVDIANSSDNYNAFNVSAGIQQQLNRNMFAQLGWSYERLDLGNNSDLVDNSARFTLLRQDQLADRLRLNSFYEFRANFGDTGANKLSQLSNTLGARLSYSLSPQWETGLDYRLSLYTFENSTEAGHQVSLVTTYRPNRTLSISGGVSYVAGSSRIDNQNNLNNLLLQVSIGINLPIAY